VLLAQPGLSHVGPDGPRDVLPDLTGEKHSDRSAQTQRDIQSAEQVAPGQPRSAHTSRSSHKGPEDRGQTDPSRRVQRARAVSDKAPDKHPQRGPEEEQSCE
jgi:hypothetical protein